MRLDIQPEATTWLQQGPFLSQRGDLSGLNGSSRCSVCMLSNSSSQRWQDVGLQLYVKLLNDAPLNRDHPRLI